MRMAGALAVAVIAGSALGWAVQDTFFASGEEKVALNLHQVADLVDRLGQMPGMRIQNGKVPPGTGTTPGGNYRGNDSCRWANDGECDDPGIGTGACEQYTDYSDCWRIATGVEDNSCQWANDGECDEPHMGTGACTQATDQADCGAVAHLRFQTDTCALAYDGVCNEPGRGDGRCEARTDRADCIGRERPMQISDHFFGHDDRMFMDTSVLPWSVIGTLTDENGGQCTATLIAEDVIITAAHCIEYDNNRIDATGTFETAFDRPGGSLTATVIDFYQSPERRADRTNNEEPSGTDWTLMRLDRPIGRELGFLGVRALVNEHGMDGAVGTALYQAGYSWDTGERLSGNTACEVVFVEDDNKIAHNCDTTQGDSGSPIMIREGDRYFIIATDSTYRIDPNVPATNIATRTEGWVDIYQDFIDGDLGNGGVRPARAVKPGAN